MDRDAGTEFEIRFTMYAFATAASEVEAEVWKDELVEHGGTPAEVEEALRMRAEIDAQRVQTIYSTPTEGPE